MHASADAVPLGHRSTAFCLREVRAEDLPQMFLWARDEQESYLWRGRPEMNNPQQFQDEIRRYLQEDLLHLVVEDERDHAPCGWFFSYSYSPVLQRCYFAGYVRPDRRAAGLGARAGLEFLERLFYHLSVPVRKVAADVYSFNGRSSRNLEKAGFRLEGATRDGHYWGGDYCDVLHYGLMRHEWDVLRDRLLPASVRSG